MYFGLRDGHKPFGAAAENYSLNLECPQRPCVKGFVLERLWSLEEMGSSGRS
jgi:hypothetical protein